MPIVPRAEDIARFAGLPVDLLGRVSGKVQESDGYSLPNQLREAREAAALLQVGPIVTEDFEQGSGSDWDIAGINAHVKRLKAGQVKGLIIKNISRLARGSGKQAWIEHEIEEAGGLIWYYDETYEETAAGRLKRAIMVDVAQFQLEQAREDSMKARYEKVAVFGRPVGNGPLPYGWRRVIDRSGARPRTIGYEHNPEHVAVIERFRALRTISTRELADQLQAEGVPVPAGFRPSKTRPNAGRWEPYTIRHILGNRMIWGEYRYGERERYRVDGKWRQRPKRNADIQTLWLPPILEKVEVMELRASIRKHGRGRTVAPTPARPVDPFILRGALVCGLCGSALRTQTVSGKARSGGEDRYYYCPLRHGRTAERQRREGCTMAPLRALRALRGGDGIEALVWDAVWTFFVDEATMRAVIRRSREIDASAETHAERLRFLRSAIAEGQEAHADATYQWSKAQTSMTRTSWEKTMARLEHDIGAYEADLAQLEQVVPSGISADEERALLELGSVVRALEGKLTPADQQALCRKLRLAVTVTPDADGAYQIGRHRYRVEGSALGQALRSSGSDKLSNLSLQLLRPNGPLLQRLTRAG